MLKYLVSGLVMALSGLTAYAQTTRVSEPVFGIQYNPMVVRFERAPALIASKCGDMRKKNLIMYAHLTYQKTQYFIVQEYLSEFGVAIAIRDAHCAEIDSDRFLYEGASAFAEQGVVVNKDQEAQLMNNIAIAILNEYSRAFGGKDKFLNALGARADNLPNSALRSELERYRRNQLTDGH